MKYVVLLCDGMADYPVPELDGKTPMAAADKPAMNRLAADGYVGLVQTVADGLKPGSDVANLSVMGYDPFVCYSGRSPLEAASIGIKMKPTDIALRCNLVTLSEEEPYTEKTMVDYCADDISSEEAAELVKALADRFNSDSFSFYAGVSYRHCLIWDHGTMEVGTLTPPHDITGQKITEHLSDHPNAAPLIKMMKESYELLKDHPINRARIARGLRPANSIWLWGEGKATALQSFEEKTGLRGTVISAVDLVKGIGKLAGMTVPDIEGATGYIDTNFSGKADAAIHALKQGSDFVYIHVEAPDECGHRHEIENKPKSISLIDHKILSPLLTALEEYDDYKVMILPDHATPLSLRTHTSDPVPFLIYHKNGTKKAPVDCLDEAHAAKTGVVVTKGPEIMNLFLTID